MTTHTPRSRPLALAAALALAAGCGPDTGRPGSSAPPAARSVGDKKTAAHDHGPGPHDGALAEWGDEEYHPEFTVDHARQQATVYILDGKAQKPRPIKAKQITLTLKQPTAEITLEARPQEGDPEGSASRFVGTHPALGKEQEFAGTISGVVDGKPYAGDFREEPHEPKGPPK